MSLREKLKDHSGITAAAAIVVIVIAGWYAFVQFRTFSAGGATQKVYYSTDDGKSWFNDSIDKKPPFEVGGKPAYGAAIFKCSDGKPFCGYLFRYTEKAQKALAIPVAKSGPQSATVLGIDAMEYKRPGESRWINRAEFAAAAAVREVKCSDNTSASEMLP